MDPVEKCDWLATVSMRCERIMRQCSDHLQQFPTARLNLENERIDLWQWWVCDYMKLNEEVKAADGFSLSDLLFVTLCYVDLAQNPEWRMCPASDQHLGPVLDIVRFMGSQHTPNTMFTPLVKQEVDSLRRTVAWIVVMKLAAPMPLAIAEVKQSDRKSEDFTTKPLDRSCVSWVTTRLEDEMQKMRAFAEPPKNAEGKYVRDLELGQFWSETGITGLFLPQCARVMHALAYDEFVLSLVEHVKEKPPLENLATLKTQLQKWVHESCLVDSADHFAMHFRSAVFESALPVNCRANARTRRSGGGNAETMPLTLLQHELGFDVATVLNDMLSTRVRSVGFDPKHPFYQHMVLHIFGHVIMHEQRVSFIRDFFINHSDLTQSLDRLKTTRRFSRNREPLIVRVQRQYWIHYIDSETRRPCWLHCSDAEEAVLFWLWLLTKHHEGELISGHNIKAWSERFLFVKKDELDIEDDV